VEVGTSFADAICVCREVAVCKDVDHSVADGDEGILTKTGRGEEGEEVCFLRDRALVARFLEARIYGIG
jgi:hypothetical protein